MERHTTRTFFNLAITVMLLFCLGFALLQVYNMSFRSERLKVGAIIKNGRIIIEGIEKYHAKYRNYPGELSELKSEFLTEIPKPGYGEWTYIRKSKDSYMLGVKSSFHTDLNFFYNSVSAEWGFKETSTTIVKQFP